MTGMPMWAHSTGLHNEIVYRADTLQLPKELQHDTAHSPELHVDFVFDRQARPHIILSCKSLTGPALGLPTVHPGLERNLERDLNRGGAIVGEEGPGELAGSHTG